MNEYQEAIKTIKCNYPPSNYSMLCEALDMAIDALEKQTPKKPVELNCPRCRFNGIDNSWWVFKFCPECGQAIDWSEED